MGRKRNDFETKHSLAWTAALRMVAEEYEGHSDVVVVDGRLTNRVTVNDVEYVGHEYSVRMPGMALWEDHLPSLARARASALEPLAMGLTEIHIVDDTTHTLIE
jgi:hypothetical protein